MRSINAAALATIFFLNSVNVGLAQEDCIKCTQITLTYAHRTTVSALRAAAASELPIRMRAGANAARAMRAAEKELL
jgi:hypothetical protein